MVPVSPVDTYTALFELDPDEARGIVSDVLPKPVSRVPVSPAMMPKATLPATTVDDELARVLNSDRACEALYHSMCLTRAEYGTIRRINQMLIGEGTNAVTPKELNNIIHSGRRIIQNQPLDVRIGSSIVEIAQQILLKCGYSAEQRLVPRSFLDVLKASQNAQNAIREGISETVTSLARRVSAILLSEKRPIKEGSASRFIIVARAFNKNPLSARKVYRKYVGYLSLAEEIFSSKDHGPSASKKARLS